MVIDKLIEARTKAGNPSFKAIADKAGCSQQTVSRIFNRKQDYPDTFTLSSIAAALGTTLDKILVDTDASVGNIDPLTDEIKHLTDEVARLTAENERLILEVAHKDEIIRLKDEIIGLLRPLT